MHNRSRFTHHIYAQLEPNSRIIQDAKRWAPIEPRTTRTDRDAENEAYLRRTEAEANRLEDEYLKKHGII